MQITRWHTDPCAVLLGSEQLSSQVPVLPQDPQGVWAPEEKDFVKTFPFYSLVGAKDKDVAKLFLSNLWSGLSHLTVEHIAHSKCSQWPSKHRSLDHNPDFRKEWCCTPSKEHLVTFLALKSISVNWKILDPDHLLGDIVAPLLIFCSPGSSSNHLFFSSFPTVRAHLSDFLNKQLSSMFHKF